MSALQQAITDDYEIFTPSGKKYSPFKSLNQIQ